MYFKELELTGFKSFADRTHLRLEPGVTAIVGPNGCGKSNILDALRWVLGEQRSKELRGSHMQDVIFNGSENRHATGMSEVSVTFDNADGVLPVDFREVQVTRRLYRSGDSEYLMNKAPCRLADIRELFMDTGIGTQAYSMIGQGQMSMILSQKPEDRRALFEEAAGIIKYKNRKKLAMRRLDAAEQNLLRLQDIVAELERQMRSLKRQVNAAIRYRELSDQLREVEIRAAWLKHCVLTRRIDEMRGQLSSAQDAYAKSSAEATALEARHEELGLAKLEADKELSDRRERVHQIETAMERLERQIALLRQQVDYAERDRNQASEDRKNLETRAEDIAKAMQDVEADIAAKEKELAEAEERVAASQAEHEKRAEAVRQAEENVERIRTQSVERMNLRAQNQTEIETLDVRIGNIDSQVSNLDTREKTEGERRQEIQTRLEAARAEEQEKNAALGEVEDRRTVLQQQIAESNQALQELNEKWQRLREEKSSNEARLNSLRELRDNYEGFAAGVRAVMRAKTQQGGGADYLEGIIGPAGDLISTEEQYERAIEAALGGSINNIIVEDAQSAKNGVNFLKRNNAGRVTFLPLDIIRGGSGDRGQTLRNRQGVVGPAIDYVSYDPRLTPAVEYLLHSTLIVETLDDAIAIARSENRYPRLVTLDGEMVSSSGAVTGGRTRHESRGMLGRSAEIEELEEKTRQSGEHIQKLAARAQALTEQMQQADRDAKDCARQESELHRELGQIGVRIARLSTDWDNVGQSLEDLEGQRQKLAEQRAEFEAKRTAAAERAENMETDDEALQQELNAAREAAEQARSDRDAHGARLNEIRMEQASLRQTLVQLQRDLERETKNREEALSQAQQRAEFLDRFSEQQVELKEKIETHTKETAQLAHDREDAQARAAESANRRQELLDETDEVDAKMREVREVVRQKQGEVHKLELDLRSDEDRLQFFNERIAEEYNIRLAELTEEQVGTDEYDEETRDKLVTDLRERIQRMGDVNLMAIEEYEAMEQRHAFLTGQCDDLRKAREALVGVIARSDKRIREMFLETFEAIANHFREFFRILFNGGQARVYLVDENDPLESGIEIEARPPGKKPTSISLLSGGESAMTAIALLVSILKAKPTPFCVLDEVDAPLDDANIGRFLDIIDEFSKDTQFVVITHSKRTMARADVMYGVTMQERGVSQIISAKLEDMRDEGESAA